MTSGGAAGLSFWDSRERDSYSSLKAAELRAAENREDLSKTVVQPSGGARSAFFDEKPLPKQQKNVDVERSGCASWFSCSLQCLEDILPLRCYACSIILYLCGLGFMIHYLAELPKKQQKKIYFGQVITDDSNSDLDAAAAATSDKITKIYFAIGLALLALPCISFCLQRCVAARIKSGLQNLIGFLLGAAVETAFVSVNLCAGSVSVEGLILWNPTTGPQWNSEHLLFVDRMGLDIRWWSLFRSCFKVIEVQRLEVEGVELVFEQAGRTSNVGLVQQNLSKILRGGDPQKGPTFVLHKVEIQDIALRIPNAFSGLGAEASVAIGDIMYEDFALEVAEGQGDFALELLLRTILKTMASNVFGLDTLRQLAGYKTTPR